jgi:hypothetical protein
MGPSAIDLRTIPLFQGFSDDELTQLGGLFTDVAVDPGQPLLPPHDRRGRAGAAG